MRRCAAMFILAAAVLLTVTTGCGTRSILVPVTRYADIDLSDADTIILPPAGTLDTGPFSSSIAERLDSLLPAMLGGDHKILVQSPSEPVAPRIFTPAGSVSRKSLRWWSERCAGDLLLGTDITHGRYSEGVTAAGIQSTRAPGSVKNVRQGRAEAVCRIVLVDMRRELLLFDDTLSVHVNRETHATDSVPPALDIAVFAEAIAMQIAGRIADASHPVADRDVVTFLVDSEFPEIDAAITYAEEGRWKMTVSLLRRIAEESTGRENADVVWYDLGLAFQYSQNFKEALAAFDRAIAIRDRSRYRHAREALLRAENDYLERLRRGQ